LDPFQAYGELYEKYNKQSMELYELGTKYYLLNKNWEQSQIQIQEVESTVHQYSMTNDGNHDHSRSTILGLERRINSLEEEKANMVQRHQRALIVAANRICAADRKMIEATEQAQDPKGVEHQLLVPKHRKRSNKPRQAKSKAARNRESAS
jgi:hypothetical protein